MTREEAMRILDPETAGEAISEIEYYGGFSGRTKAAQAVSDACILAVEAIREQEERSKPKESQPSDVIREKLVELLKTNACPSPFMCDPACRYYGFGDCFPDRFADHLISNGVTVQEWISVDDRLPEPGERVLATDGGFVGEFYINSQGQWQRYNVNNYSLLMALDILWWMPLPEPPKEE